jgi:PEP-CTERM motif
MRKYLLAATAGALLTGYGSNAEALDFTFSFAGDSNGNVPGTVTGTIDGLAVNGTSAATDVTITSAPAGLGISSFPIDMVAVVINNSFTTSGNTIIAANFDGFVSGYTAELSLNGADTINYLATDSSSFVVKNLDGFDGVTYTAVGAPAAVPEPYSLAVLGVGLLGLAVTWAPRRLSRMFGIDRRACG